MTRRVCAWCGWTIWEALYLPSVEPPRARGEGRQDYEERLARWKDATHGICPACSHALEEGFKVIIEQDPTGWVSVFVEKDGERTRGGVCRPVLKEVESVVRFEIQRRTDPEVARRVEEHTRGLLQAVERWGSE